MSPSGRAFRRIRFINNPENGVMSSNDHSRSTVPSEARLS